MSLWHNSPLTLERLAQFQAEEDAHAASQRKPTAPRQPKVKDTGSGPRSTLRTDSLQTQVLYLVRDHPGKTRTELLELAPHMAQAHARNTFGKALTVCHRSGWLRRTGTVGNVMVPGSGYRYFITEKAPILALEHAA